MTTRHSTRVKLTRFDRDLMKMDHRDIARWVNLDHRQQAWVRQHYNLGHRIDRSIHDISQGLDADGFD